MKKILFTILIALSFCACNNAPAPEYAAAYISSIDFKKIPQDGTYGVDMYDSKGKTVWFEYVQYMRVDHLDTDGKMTFKGGIRLSDTEPYYYDLRIEGEYPGEYTNLLERVYIGNFATLKALGFPKTTHATGDNLVLQFNYTYIE